MPKEKSSEEATPSRRMGGACLGREDLAAVQMRKLGALFGAIRPANLFCARKLSGCDPGWLPGSLAEYAAAVPFTTKEDLIQDRLANPPYGTGLTYPVSAYVRCHQTSGTTATPIRWLDTPESWACIVENWSQIFDVAGVAPRDRCFFAFSFGPFLAFWPALEAAVRLGCFVFPGGAMSSLARAQAILDNGITVLCCTPTYAQHLGEVAQEKKLDLAAGSLRRIIVAGEPGGSVPAIRARIERLWPGAAVYDHYGMTEVGPATYPCPARPGVLHVFESGYIPEVIHPQTGAPVVPGETGELVLTTLDRTGSPLLRYRTGDLVKPGPARPCVCGRQDLALEGGIVGRSDDMVVVRGVKVYPGLIEELVRGFPEVREYRVHLCCRGALSELALEIETGAGGESLAPRVEERLQRTLNLRVPVRVVPAGSLPRFEMKAQRWIRSVE